MSNKEKLADQFCGGVNFQTKEGWLSAEECFLAGWDARSKDVEELEKMAKEWERLANEWREDYDRLKNKYEPMVAVISEESK